MDNYIAMKNQMSTKNNDIVECHNQNAEKRSQALKVTLSVILSKSSKMSKILL